MRLTKTETRVRIRAVLWDRKIRKIKCWSQKSEKLENLDSTWQQKKAFGWRSMCLRDNKRGANTEAESLEETSSLPVEAARKETVFHIPPPTSAKQVRKVPGHCRLLQIVDSRFCWIKEINSPSYIKKKGTILDGLRCSWDCPNVIPSYGTPRCDWEQQFCQKFLLRDWDPGKDLWHTCKKLDLVAVEWPACLHIVASGQGHR